MEIKKTQLKVLQLMGYAVITDNKGNEYKLTVK